MAKTTPKAATTKKPQTVPLSEISITWKHRTPWQSEADATPATITGAQLARLLDLLYLKLDKQPDEDLASHRLEGLSELLQGVVNTDYDHLAAASALRDILRDVAFDIRSAADHAESVLKTATVAIAPAVTR